MHLVRQADCRSVETSSILVGCAAVQGIIGVCPARPRKSSANTSGVGWQLDGKRGLPARFAPSAAAQIDWRSITLTPTRRIRFFVRERESGHGAKSGEMPSWPSARSSASTATLKRQSCPSEAMHRTEPISDIPGRTAAVAVMRARRRAPNIKEEDVTSSVSTRSCSGPYKAALPADSREDGDRYPGRAPSGRGANGDALRLRRRESTGSIPVARTDAIVAKW